ncbi:hypothetical protein Tco_0827150 [Tanacetum coccineum]
MDVRLWAKVGTHSVVAPVKLAEVPGTFHSVLVSTGPFLLIQLNRASSYIVHGCKYIECYNLPGKRTNLASGTFELHSIGWVVSQFATVRSEELRYCAQCLIIENEDFVKEIAVIDDGSGNDQRNSRSASIHDGGNHDY